MISKNSTRVSLKEHIYTEVFEQIIRGEYHDVSIINEKMLIEKFNVSKSPVREALIALCNEGVLRNIPRYGYEIVRISEKDVAKIRDYRIVIECGFMDRYWHMLTPEKTQKLKEFQLIYKQKIECSALEHWNRNSTFHLKLAACYENDFMYNSLMNSLRVLARAYAQFHWDATHKTIFLSKADAHDKLLKCVETGEKQKAIEYLEKDICSFENDLCV